MRMREETNNEHITACTSHGVSECMHASTTTALMQGHLLGKGAGGVSECMQASQDRAVAPLLLAGKLCTYDEI
jgi:hypothetical protein